MRSAICASVLVLTTLCASKAQDLSRSGETIYFSVRDKQMRPVLGLEEKDFKLTVRGKYTAFADFQSGKNTDDQSVPLVAWIMIDSSAAIPPDVIEAQSESVTDLFSDFSPRSAIGVMTYDDNYRVQAPLGSDAEKVRDVFERFNQIRSAASRHGFVAALEYAVDEVIKFSNSRPDLKDARRAVMVLSPWDVAAINFDSTKREIYSKAIGGGVSLYPVCVILPNRDQRKGGGITAPPPPPIGAVPRGSIINSDSWPYLAQTVYQQFFDMAEKTGGIGSYFGDPSDSPNISTPSNTSAAPNALTVNFETMIRDLNGKYSFKASKNDIGKLHVQLTARRRDAAIVLPQDQ